MDCLLLPNCMKHYLTQLSWYLLATAALFLGLVLPARAEQLIISSVTVQDVPADTLSKSSGASVKLSWLTNQDATGRVDFGLTTTYGSYVGSSDTPARSHEVTLAGLKGETTYHFKLSAYVVGQPRLESFDQTFRTSRYVDTTKPIISDVRITFAGGTYFIVTWVTDKPSDSGVDFSTNENMSRPGGAGGNRDTTNHEVVVGGLRPYTVYYATVHSTDRNGNRENRGGLIVNTTKSDSGDKEPLLLSQVSPVSWPDPHISATGITFTWHTNQPSRGTVEVRGPGGKRVDESGYLATDHALSVLNLKPDTTYSVRISVGDIFRHGVASGDITLRTSSVQVTPPPRPEPPAQVLGASCGNPQAYGAPCRNLALEQKVAAQLKVALTRYFKGRVPPAARRNWFVLVKAATYGHYPAQALIQSVRFGGKTVHPTIPWEQWKNSTDYRVYINH